MKLKMSRLLTRITSSSILVSVLLTEQEADRLWVRLLTHTLVPLVVLDVALRTATAVTSQHVLAAMLTAVVAATFIHI